MNLVEGPVFGHNGVLPGSSVHEIAARPSREFPGVEVIFALAAQEHVATTEALHGPIVSWPGVYPIVAVREGIRPRPAREGPLFLEVVVPRYYVAAARGAYPVAALQGMYLLVVVGAQQRVAHPKIEAGIGGADERDRVCLLSLSRVGLLLLGAEQYHPQRQHRRQYQDGCGSCHIPLLFSSP